MLKGGTISNKIRLGIVSSLNYLINNGLDLVKNNIEGNKKLELMYDKTIGFAQKISGFDHLKDTNSFDVCTIFLLELHKELMLYTQTGLSVGIDMEENHIAKIIKVELLEKAIYHIFQEYDHIRNDNDMKSRFKLTFKSFCDNLGDLKLSLGKNCDRNICERLSKRKPLIDGIKQCRLERELDNSSKF